MRRNFTIADFFPSAFNGRQQPVKGNKENNNRKADYCKLSHFFSAEKRNGNGVEYRLNSEQQCAFNLVHPFDAAAEKDICKTVLENAENEHPDYVLCVKGKALVKKHERKAENKAYYVAEIQTVVAVAAFAVHDDYLRGKGHAGKQTQHVAEYPCGIKTVRKGNYAAAEDRKRNDRLGKLCLFLLKNDGI